MRPRRLWRTLGAVGLALGALAGAYAHDERATDRELAPYRAVAAMRVQGQARVDVPATVLRASARLSPRFVDEPADPAAREAVAGIDAELGQLARELEHKRSAHRLVLAATPFAGARVAAALAVRARDLAEKGRGEEAAESLVAVLVLAKATREQGTTVGVVLGTDLATRAAQAITRLRSSLDARALSTVADVAWPSSVDALEATRRERAQLLTEWAFDGRDGPWLPALARKNLALAGLERFDEELAVLGSAATSGADACAALDAIPSSVVDRWTAVYDGQLLCTRLAKMRAADEAVARLKTSLR